MMLVSYLRILAHIYYIEIYCVEYYSNKCAIRNRKFNQLMIVLSLMFFFNSPLIHKDLKIIYHCGFKVYNWYSKTVTEFTSIKIKYQILFNAT